MLQSHPTPTIESWSHRGVRPIQHLTPHLCKQCGSVCVEVRNARDEHAWWQCVLCNNLPYVPLDWRVQWPSTGATPE